MLKCVTRHPQECDTPSRPLLNRRSGVVANCPRDPQRAKPPIKAILALRDLSLKGRYPLIANIGFGAKE